MARVPQTDVIDFLADPATHSGSPVRRIDTHASVIFLASNLAYKLKRGIRYFYLDYSSVKARRRACEAALNRRTAPEIYLRALPISRDAAGTLRLGGEGAAVDWVVVMRRFDDDLLFDRLAQRRPLTLDQMLELAGEIADFHRFADVDRPWPGLPAAGLFLPPEVLSNLIGHYPQPRSTVKR